jgi:hypothetical protein
LPVFGVGVLDADAAVEPPADHTVRSAARCRLPRPRQASPARTSATVAAPIQA